MPVTTFVHTPKIPKVRYLRLLRKSPFRSTAVFDSYRWVLALGPRVAPLWLQWLDI
jgi:hypothetical protein